MPPTADHGKISPHHGLSMSQQTPPSPHKHQNCDSLKNTSPTSVHIFSDTITAVLLLVKLFLFFFGTGAQVGCLKHSSKHLSWKTQRDVKWYCGSIWGKKSFWFWKTCCFIQFTPSRSFILGGLRDIDAWLTSNWFLFYFILSFLQLMICFLALLCISAFVFELQAWRTPVCTAVRSTKSQWGLTWITLLLWTWRLHFLRSSGS